MAELHAAAAEALKTRLPPNFYHKYLHGGPCLNFLEKELADKLKLHMLCYLRAAQTDLERRDLLTSRNNFGVPVQYQHSYTFLN